jgi:murein DD-endopeptidase MepM/ murein hydrolase activator NlpD
VTGRTGTVTDRTGAVTLPPPPDRRRILLLPREGSPLPRSTLRAPGPFRISALLSLVLAGLLVLVVAAPDSSASETPERRLAAVGERLAMGSSHENLAAAATRTPLASTTGANAQGEDAQDGATDVTAEPAVDRTATFAQIGDLELRLPSHDVVVHGFHEGSSPSSVAMTPVGDQQRVLPSRGRPYPATSAVDIVLVDDEPVRSPVTGTVEVAERYALYGKHGDRRITIVPDDAPELRVVVLHVSGVGVEPGERVEAGETVIASSARRFPFRSQIDDVTAPESWPHVHYEVRRHEEG